MLSSQIHAKVYGTNSINYTQNKIANHCQSLYRKDLLAHFGCVNAINFSRNGNFLVSGGDDRRVVLWNSNEIVHNITNKPIVMKSTHQSNIFSTIFDCCTEYIFSSGNDEKVIRHDIESLSENGRFLFDEAIYSIDVSLHDQHFFATAGEDGTVQLCDVRNNNEYTRLAFSGGAFHSVSFNPVDPRLVATANSVDGISLWDIRIPEKKLFTYGCSSSNKSAMSVCFDYTGSKLLAMLRCDNPMLFDIGKKEPLQEFSSYGFNNKCTMKSACFAGDKDQFIVAGSENFKIYFWERDHYLETQDAHFMLEGHRSIVNQVRFNRQFSLLASSGVEKSIKVWSPYQFSGCVGDITGEESFIQRKCYSRHERERLYRHQQLSHDYSAESLEEDTGMLAFFDALIEKSQENSDSSDSENDHPIRALSAVLNLIDLPPLSTEVSLSNEVSDETSSDGNILGSAPRLERTNLEADIYELRKIFRGNTQPERGNTQPESSRTAISFNNDGNMNKLDLENSISPFYKTNVNVNLNIENINTGILSNKADQYPSDNCFSPILKDISCGSSQNAFPVPCSSNYTETNDCMNSSRFKITIESEATIKTHDNSVDTSVKSGAVDSSLSPEVSTFYDNQRLLNCDVCSTYTTSSDQREIDDQIRDMETNLNPNFQTGIIGQFKKSEKRKKRKYRATNEKKR
ncbi:DDB1- and CUL4-associated factor 5 isoform X1 [Hydra vulgaris]|uniref:DDB1- and CUL4-associated factor 5 isoform X1 n=1 Tax=Hydra vulgaris TaxID=6087 RepID=UPI000640EE4D|nr:DDB1- and CUL4-associated factor 5 [Hydra vulgaris]